jgi:Protein of unknown function (DUF3072)
MFSVRLFGTPAGTTVQMHSLFDMYFCQEAEMTQKQTTQKQTTQDTGNMIKDPKDWKTGDEPMTGAQRSYLGTLAQEAGEETPEDLTKAEAAEKIDELQEQTGRGKQA